MSEPAVHCISSEIIPSADLVLHRLNPNEHPDNQIELLARVIERFGWRRPVTVSNLSGQVVRGNGRVLAARSRGWSVPVDRQEYRSHEEEVADLAADNILADLSRMSHEAMREIAEEFGLEAVDLGLTDEALDKLISAAGNNVIVSVDLDSKGKAMLLSGALKYEGFSSSVNKKIEQQ